MLSMLTEEIFLELRKFDIILQYFKKGFSYSNQSCYHFDMIHTNKINISNVNPLM